MKNQIGLGTVVLLALAISGCKSKPASTNDHSSNASHTQAATSQDHHAQGLPAPEHSHQGRHGRNETAHNQEPAGTKPSLGMAVGLPVVKDNSGKEFRLETLRSSEGNKGKIVVLTFWCTFCHSCRVIEQDFDKKAKKYAEQGVLFAMVDSSFTDSPESVNQFLAKFDLGFPVLMDPNSEYARYFGTKLTTTTAVIDAEGRLRYYGGFPKAEDAVKNLVAGEDVALPETRGFG